jgi:hypothetical protein
MRQPLSLAATLVSAVLCLHAGDAPPALDPLIPPSPSSAPGIRIWPEPQFTHWPAIAYADETRNVAFSLPVKQGGVAGSIGWNGDKPLPFTLPTGTESISGLLPLALAAKRYEGTATLVDRKFPLALTVADAREAWPLAGLRNGFPIDAKGDPVVLLDRRRGSKDERVWSLLESTGTRPDGKPVVVGDPLEAMGGDAWTGLEAELLPVGDERYPHHAVLVALATVLGGGDPGRLPRTIAWCPGNQVLFGGAWSSEEERMLGVIRTRCERLGAAPRLLLALPPLPVDERLKAQAQERRDLLARSANRLGWAVIDLGRAAGDPASANQVAPGVFTRYPLGEAQARMRRLMADALAR